MDMLHCKKEVQILLVVGYYTLESRTDRFVQPVVEAPLRNPIFRGHIDKTPLSHQSNRRHRLCTRMAHPIRKTRLAEDYIRYLLVTQDLRLQFLDSTLDKE